MHGYVRYIWPDSYVYQGFMHLNKRHGYGTYYGKDGTIIYQGEWKENKKESSPLKIDEELNFENRWAFDDSGIFKEMDSFRRRE